MPIYKAPVEDVSFLLNDVFQIDRYDNLPGFTDASADVREAILDEAAKLSEKVLAAAESHRRSRRLQAPRRRQRHHAEGLQGSLQAGRRRRLARALGAGGIWRAGAARDAEPGRHRIPELRQHGVLDVWRPDHGRDRCAAGARQAANRRRCSCRRWWRASGPAP